MVARIPVLEAMSEDCGILLDGQVYIVCFYGCAFFLDLTFFSVHN